MVSSPLRQGLVASSPAELGCWLGGLWEGRNVGLRGEAEGQTFAWMVGLLRIINHLIGPGADLVGWEMEKIGVWLVGK